MNIRKSWGCGCFVVEMSDARSMHYKLVPCGAERTRCERDAERPWPKSTAFDEIAPKRLARLQEDAQKPAYGWGWCTQCRWMTTDVDHLRVCTHIETREQVAGAYRLCREIRDQGPCRYFDGR